MNTEPICKDQRAEALVIKCCCLPIGMRNEKACSRLQQTPCHVPKVSKTANATISLENCDQKSATKLFTHWHSCHTTHSCSHGPHGGCANCAHGHAHSSHIAWRGATHLGTSWATLKNLWQSTESTGIVIPFEETWQQIMAPPEAFTPVTMMEIEQPVFSMGWFPLRMG